MGKMQIMDVTGDIKVEWNPDNEKEVGVAEKSFNEYIKKGFKAYRIYDDGKKGEPIEKFDKFAERILFVVPIAGG